MIRRKVFLSVCVTALSLTGAAIAASAIHPALWPRAASPAAITDGATERRISDLLAQMTIEDKVGQTIDADISAISPDDLKIYPIGALLAGGDSGPNGNARAPAADWVRMIARFRAANDARLGAHPPIPLIFGIDAIHGNNHIPGATIFPHNIGLGAARDPELIEEIGAASAREVAAIGADWSFGPTVAVPRDIRWGRSYEGFGEDPEIVASYAGRMTLGLQGVLHPGANLAPDHIMGSAKHFLADGGTLDGKDQGDAQIREEDLIRLHVAGYPPAIDAGVLSVMVSFSSWEGTRHIVNRGLLSDVLKGRMGFRGFVVGDWNAQGEVPGCSNEDCPQAMNAGLDMYMAPDSWKGLFHHLVGEVRAGKIPMARLDDAVRRILRAKMKIGLFENPPARHADPGILGNPGDRALARRAVHESVVLLKNDGVLPVRAGSRLLVAGSGADNIPQQCGGWTISWQGTGNSNRDFPQGQSIYAGIAAAQAKNGGTAMLSPGGRFGARPDVAIVVFGEEPYAEFQGDIRTLEYQPGAKRDLALLQRLRKAHIPVVAVFLSGRPLWTNPEINASDAFVAAWLPGSEGGAIADLLIAQRNGKPSMDFKGKLSFSWPASPQSLPRHREDRDYRPQFAYGYGLSYAHPGEVGRLSEAGEARYAPPSEERYFDNGRVAQGWNLQAHGDAAITAIDAGAQENARLADFTGEGGIAITGDTIDISRQTTGDMALLLRYQVRRRPDGKVTLGLGCGVGCGAMLDASSIFSAMPKPGWQTAMIKLSCFAKNGASMNHIDSPFMLASTGSFSAILGQITLASDNGHEICLPPTHH